MRQTCGRCKTDVDAPPGFTICRSCRRDRRRTLARTQAGVHILGTTALLWGIGGFVLWLWLLALSFDLFDPDASVRLTQAIGFTVVSLGGTAAGATGVRLASRTGMRGQTTAAFGCALCGLLSFWGLLGILDSVT